jgi:glycosyltransferase involved in cell wall biosynthesis
MKIIVCNKYFFLNGGTDKYLHDLMPQLSAMGHTVVPFSVRYAGSWSSAYSSFFLPPPGPPEQIYFSNFRLTGANWLRYLDRSVYSVEARFCLQRLIREVGGADIAYLLNIYNYMSPSIIHTFRRHGIPVVMRLGDYNLLCPSYLFLRDGRPCTLCLKGSYQYGVKFRCVKNSFPASVLRVMSMYVQRLLKIYDYVDAFVVPCGFMRQKLIEGGFPGEKIHMLRSPVVSQSAARSGAERRHILYFGRISIEKGIETLIGAYQQLPDPPDLILAGRSYDGEKERLERLILPGNRERIRFAGFREGADLSDLISGALLTVVPSLWYDNAPLSIYESFLHETPVAASSIGGITEQVQDGITGKLFLPGAEAALKKTLLWMLEDHERLRKMGIAGKEFVREQSSLDTHAGFLLDLFEGVGNKTMK